MMEVEMDGGGLDVTEEAMDGGKRANMCKKEKKKIDKLGVEWERLEGSVKRKRWKCTWCVI